MCDRILMWNLIYFNYDYVIIGENYHGSQPTDSLVSCNWGVRVV